MVGCGFSGEAGGTVEEEAGLGDGVETAGVGDDSGADEGDGVGMASVSCCRSSTGELSEDSSDSLSVDSEEVW